MIKKLNGLWVTVVDVEISAGDEERFWQYVNVKSVSECWEWAGTDCNMRVNGSVISAVKLSWIINGGEELGGHRIGRLCKSSGCVNPTHLFMKKDGNRIPWYIGCDEEERLLDKSMISRAKELENAGVGAEDIASAMGCGKEYMKRLLECYWWMN